ncbi:MAG: hypothetical protein WBV23_12895 [Desulfobaccales bacterium]
MAKMNSTIQNTFSTMTSGKENDQRHGVNNTVPHLLLFDYIQDYVADLAKRLKNILREEFIKSLGTRAFLSRNRENGT